MEVFFHHEMSIHVALTEVKEIKSLSGIKEKKHQHKK